MLFMKRTICFLLLLGSFCNSLHAQSVFYALTPANGAGVISRYNAATNNLTIAHAFENPGTNPFNSEFVEGADGKLYSTTAFGGAFNKGVIFSLDPVTNAETKLLDLNST